MDRITICSMNCRGLGQTQKRDDILHFLKEKKYSLYCIQETHFTKKSENIIRAKWGYKTHFNSCSSNAKGLVILINNNFDYKFISQYNDPDGHFMFLKLSIEGNTYTLVNLHAPNNDSPDFFENLSQKLKELSSDEHVILTGDWNLILNPMLDYSNYKHINNPNSRQKVLSLLEEFNLVDIWREMHPNRTQFSWRRKKPLQQARLDFFLVSETIAHDIIESEIGPSYRSDHSLVTITMHFGQPTIKRNTFWKFNVSLLKDQNYINIVKNTIKETKEQYAASPYNFETLDNIPSTDIQFQIGDQLFLETLLCQIRGNTISYSSYKKKEQHKREKWLKREVLNIEKDLNHQNDKTLEELQHELQDIRQIRMEGVKIRTKARWIAKGEKNTKYFCNLENRHYTSKLMKLIEKEDGEHVTDPNEILKEAEKYYKELYQSRESKTVQFDQKLFENCNFSTLSDQQRDDLEGQITLVEASAALKQMENGKSPGSDGFTVEFFKFFWKDLGIFLIRSINEGFEKGYLSSTQKQGIITLIPKGEKPKQFLKNWRPISLLNVTYKIASACIANRIKKILPLIIHEDQCGFMSGRSTADNIRLIYDMIHFTEKYKKPGLLLLIDFEKAFDSIAHSFIRNSLKLFNFGPEFVKWIDIFNRRNESCLIINGQVSSRFAIERGCRQGDPLSPYIFLVCAELLAMRFRNNENIKGIKVGDTEHLISQFADDTSLFLDGSESSFNNAMLELKTFNDLSGLKINFDKTVAIWLGITKQCLTRFMPDLNIRWNPSTFTVLGITFSLDLSKMIDLNYRPRLQNMHRIIKQWEARDLTPIGRITVFKSLILSTFTYLLISLPSPNHSVLEEIYQASFKFIWNKKRDKIKRTTLIKPYEEGGLRVIDIHAFHKALKITWLRKMNTSNAGWKYLISSLNQGISQYRMYGSYFFKRFQGLNPFWKDVFSCFAEFCGKCCPMSESDFKHEPLFFNCNIIKNDNMKNVRKWMAKDVYTVGHIMNDGCFLAYEAFQHKFGIQINFLDYYSRLTAIRSYMNRTKNKWNKNGNSCDMYIPFSILFRHKKGTKGVYEKLSFVDGKPTCNDKWNISFQNLKWRDIYMYPIMSTQDTKLRWFQYRVIHRVLTTNVWLKCRGLKNTDLCTFCNQERETIEHLLFDCRKTKTFWCKMLSKLKSKTTHCGNLDLNKELILFGTQKNVKLDKPLNILLLMAKFYIFRCKCLEKELNFSIFIKEYLNRLNTEKYIHTVEDRNKVFEQNWNRYLRFAIDDGG